MVASASAPVPRHVLALGPAHAGCDHLRNETAERMGRLLQRYAAGLRWGQRVLSGKIRPQDALDEPRRADKRRKLEYPVCAMCSMDMRRPFVCLECAHTACLFRDPVREPSLPVSVGSARSAEHIEHGTSHMGLHLAEESHAYGTWPPDPACDIVHGTLFCAACDDVVYDPRFLYVCEQETRRSHVMRPDEHALDTSMAQDALLPRGLRNMGATCFLNVILQSFLHNPLLRNFFLSDRHNAGLCAVGPYCLACEMDRLYREVRTPHSPQFYTPSDTPAPHGPTSFLYAIWVDSSSAELSQSGQHDAHEMFISALNGIHTALTAYALERSKLPSAPWDSADTLKHLSEHADVTGAGADMPKRAVDHSARCPCVVHRTFCGRLQSTITCASCRQMTHTREPFLDLSLEVRARDPRDTDDRNKKKDTKRRDKATPSLDTSLETLQACLQRYCSPELLPDNSYKCSHCQQTSKATKQLSLLQLPPVLCIQLKRYEHGLGATKVDTRVHFPLTLDVADCCVAAASEDELLDPFEYAYDLFTVVVHEGTLTSGHYTNFSKWRGHWYRFDDDKVTHAKVSQVLDARAYQLFYIRRRLRNHTSHGLALE